MIIPGVFVYFLTAVNAARDCSNYLLQDVPDHKINASSQASEDRQPAFARLNADGNNWCPNASDISSSYIQVEFSGWKDVVGIVTQGSKNLKNWITKYKISYSYDGENWLTVVNSDNTHKIFDGNVDQNTLKINNMDKPISLKLLRIHPTSFHDYPCMRLDVLGCDTVGYEKCWKFLVSGSGGVSDNKLYTNYNSALRQNARLFVETANTYFGSRGYYIQVTFNGLKKVAGVVTRGGYYSVWGWVTGYKFQYYWPNSRLKTILNDDKTEKVFEGNTDGSTPKLTMFDYPIETIAWRIVIESYHVKACLRFDVLGCDTIKTDGCREYLVSGPQGVSDDKLTSSLFTSPPAKARLDAPGSSWCASLTVNYRYIQVEFDDLKKVTGVVTQGRPDADNWVKYFHVTYSIDGSRWFSVYDASNYIQRFYGNYNRNTHRINTFHNGLLAKFVRIFPYSWHNNPCLRFDVLGCDLEGNAYCNEYLVSGANGIPDSQIVTSSDYRDYYSGAQSRINTREQWCSRGSYFEYIQANFSDVVSANAVVTESTTLRYYVVQHSLDGNTWTSLLENDGVYKKFKETGSSLPMVNVFDRAVNARFLRIVPVTSSRTCLRFDVLGCSKISKSCSEFLVSGPRGISDDKLQANSVYSSSFRPSNARLTSMYYPWCPGTSDSNVYFQVELDGLTNVTGIVIQGKWSHNEYIRTFTLQHSLNGTIWTKFEESGSEKIFFGNANMNTPVNVQISPAIQTKFLRIFPKWRNVNNCMRLDVLGCSLETKDRKHQYGEILPLVVDNTIKQLSIWEQEQVSDVDQCIVKCYKDWNCLSFSYDQHNRSCSGYNTQFYRNDKIEEGTTTQSYYFDKSLLDHLDYTLDRDAGLCYRIFTSRMSQTDAKDFCQSQQTRLLSVVNSEQVDILRQFKKSNFILDQHTRFRVDGEYHSATSSWRYFNNRAIPDELWVESGKNPELGKCVVFTGQGLKADRCDEPGYFICGI